MAWLDALQSSALAQALAQSRWAPAVLSSVHLVGFTLVMSGGMMSHLRLVGAFSPDRPAPEVTGPAWRVILAGLAVSLLTGGLLFAPRASAAAGNPIFQLKMLLLLAGVLLQSTAVPRAARAEPGPGVTLIGVAGLAVWLALALAGCAFILYE